MTRFAAFALTLAALIPIAVLVVSFRTSLPYWCAHADAPHSGNWLPVALGMCKGGK